MPRESSRQEGKVVQKSIDKEQKRNRGAISCAECRRLKLKCDKTVPCSSCKRRGCSTICPNGSLTTGQGTRFVLADTEQLHDKVSRMSDRIRQLEDALAILQSSVSPGKQHPLLSRDLLSVKSSIEFHAAAEEDTIATGNANADNCSHNIEAFGTLALRDDGAATFYGPSAGSESLLIGETAEASLPFVTGDLLHDLPKKGTLNLDYLLHNHLPPWERAHRLSELYLSQASWFFGPVTRQQLMEECLPSWYGGAAGLSPLGPAISASEPGAERFNKGPHDLALLFAVFCLGALMDDALPSSPDNEDEEARMYAELTKAALNLEPVLERPPSVATVQALALLAMTQGALGGDNSVEGMWSTMGLATRMAQSIGLHRDCARWRLPPSEVQKRRALFWELYITDCWQALATGRLATFHLPYVDCKLPSDPDANINDDGSVVPSFPAWRANLAHDCVSAVVQHIQAAKVPKYSDITELDRKIRDMELPIYTQRPPDAGAGLEETMKYYMPSNYRNMTLLYVHRCFFAEAVSSNPANPMKSPYAPSFLAGYRSSWEFLASLRTQYDHHPAQIARLWCIWSHAFSSAVVLSSVVTHTTSKGARSKITSAALAEFRRAVDLFKDASTYGSRAGKFLPILQRLLQKAEYAHKTSTPIVDHNKDIFTPSTYDEIKDDLTIFSGQTYKVSIKAPTRPILRSGSSRSVTVTVKDSIQLESDGVSDSEIANFPHLHPMLRKQWLDFNGYLRSRTFGAHRDDSYSEQDTETSVGDGSLTTGRQRRPPNSSFPWITQRPPFSPMSSSGYSTKWYGGNLKDCQPLEQVTEQHAQLHLSPSVTPSTGLYQFQPGVGQFHHSQSEPPLPSSNSMSILSPLNPHPIEPHSGNDSLNYSDLTSPHIWPQCSPSDSVVNSQPYSSHGSQHRSTTPISSDHLPVTQSVSSHLATDYAPQHHLQETWQSFGMYVGSPTPFPM
ncbi:fungal-specific transcription factor domain-containing protein [Pisolithus croceorrhizus]|nr:fungal-specific transcription factor domain-containing protein [Pisolithus croceorrhizus]